MYIFELIQKFRFYRRSHGNHILDPIRIANLLITNPGNLSEFMAVLDNPLSLFKLPIYANLKKHTKFSLKLSLYLIILYWQIFTSRIEDYTTVVALE